MKKSFAIALALLALSSAAPKHSEAQPVPAVNSAMGCVATQILGNVSGNIGCIPNIQAANATLAADCTWSVTFGTTFASSSPIVHASVIQASPTQPIPCVVATRSATVATGKCFPAQTTLLSLSIVTTGLTLAPFASTCTNGTPVMVVGREPTQ